MPRLIQHYCQVALLLLLGLLSACSTARSPRAANYGAPEVARAAPEGLRMAEGRLMVGNTAPLAFERTEKAKPKVGLFHYDDAAGISAMRALQTGSQPRATAACLEFLPKVRCSILDAKTRTAQPAESCGEYLLCTLRAGKEYALLLENGSDSPLEFVVSVDGQSVMDRRPASLQKRGYVVRAGTFQIIDGWRQRDRQQIRAFLATGNFSAREDRRRASVGVIGVAVFPAKTWPNIKENREAVLSAEEQTWLAY